MAVTPTPVFVQTPKIATVKIVNADGTTAAGKTIVTAGSNGSKIVAVGVTSDDTSARTIQLWYTRSAVNNLLGTATVAITGGSDGSTAGLDLLRGGSAFLNPWLPIDNDGENYIFLQSGDTLTCNATVAVTAAKTVYVTAVYADF